MFFRREKLHVPTFSELLDRVRGFGLTVANEGSSKARISKGDCAAIVEDRGVDVPHVNKAGMMIGGEIGFLVHGGYQMFWETPSGKVQPALAGQLKALHAFEEDLKEALGLVSLYNESLGTTCDQHMYDRVLHRED